MEQIHESQKSPMFRVCQDLLKSVSTTFFKNQLFHLHIRKKNNNAMFQLRFEFLPFSLQFYAQNWKSA